MDMPVSVQLLGRPRVWSADNAVHFPFKQAEALFYYLLLEREAAKDVLAEVIWEASYDADKAQSSMRNAIYVLRKQFGRGILIEPVKSTLQIDPALRPACDVDRLFTDEVLPPDFYRGDFLEGFLLKKSPLYNEWADAKRRELQGLYIKKCTARIADSLERRDLDLCEALCEQLLRIDSYEDMAYLSLIEAYRLQGQYAKAAAVYDRLETLYREELFESPSPQMREAARQLRQEAQEAQATQDGAPPPGPAARPPLFGRVRERAAILAVLERFFSEGAPSGVIVTGEAGVGKTRLLEDVLETAAGRLDALVCPTACFQVEEKYALRPWQPILRRLRDHLEPDSPAPAMAGDGEGLRYIDAEAAAAYLLGNVSKRRRLILFFDDLQWADEATISLIHRIAADRGIPVFFVLLLQEEAVRHRYSRNFLSRMQSTGQMELFALHRLNADDTAAMARSLLPGRPLSKEDERQLYRETEGNPLFIVELANSIRGDASLREISPNIRELIKNRIADLTPNCQNLLELLSLFYSGASFELLKSLSQKDDALLVDELEELIGRNFLRERLVDGELVYRFTHQKIAEFIYSGMSQAKRRVFHRKAGAYYEDLLRKGRGGSWLYTYLIHHYERAGLRDKYLEYTIHYIHAYLGMAHEYFPVVNPAMVGADSAGDQPLTNVQGLGMHITMDEILALLAEFTTGLGENSAAWDPRSRTLISHCYHLIARYYIQSCHYEDGLKYIFRIKQLNRRAAEPEQVRSLLAACKQQLYIYINRSDAKGMHSALDEAFSLLPLLEDPMETAVWIRMRGMCGVMTGNIEGGVDDLEKAIRLFRGAGDSKLFLYNIAAAYAWLGEARRYLFDNEAAAAYYRQAISTCESYYWIGGVAVFYTYAGVNAYDSGDDELAGAYLDAAVDSYGRSSFLWGRGYTLGYRALLCVKRGEHAQAMECLDAAERCARTFGSRYEQGCLLRVKATLRLRMEEDDACRAAFETFLPDAAENYIRQARAMLRGVFSPVEGLHLAGLERLQLAEPERGIRSEVPAES